MAIKSVEDARSRTWRSIRSGHEFLVSASNDLVDREFINQAFNSKEMYWAKPLDAATVELMLSQSLTLSLYKATETLEQIGMARFVTDYTTLVYLTDVYVLPTYQGLGLGKWIIACCDALIHEVPALRRVIFITGPGQGKTFYERELGCHDIYEDRETTIAMTRKGSWKKQ
ncbi:hypothetical protein K431DRAFT_218512 [Polychaeton citri CBS 116435]|uniref:N-acetyltransferase domain-containing protein n=1 Tax=Polychaeton citri CBS 116435 TaxID=1314669 RepID=A0A9P4URM2_9PEZI|nr:hypothetical protein K431DRAFT_218512 [Polychaeton citri CBS 116435]